MFRRAEYERRKTAAEERLKEQLVLEVNEGSDGTLGQWLAGKGGAGLTWDRGEAKMRAIVRNYGECTKNLSLDQYFPESEELFAATPPLEAKKLLFSMAVTSLATILERF